MKSKGNKGKNAPPASRKPLTGLLFCLGLGLLLICAADRFFSSLAAPRLAVRLVASDSGRTITARLVNMSNRDIAVALDNVHSYLVPVPNVEHEYVIHVRNIPGASPQPPVILPRNGDLLLADLSRHLRISPGGTPLVISVIFDATRETPGNSDEWHGSVRSTRLAAPSLGAAS